MKFNLYLRSCRQKYKLTQEELVQDLYNFDESFIGVDTRTVARWEAAQTQPSIERQITIIKLFSTLSGHILSCFHEKCREDIENEICKVGVRNLIGTSKEHILSFPSQSFKLEFSSIRQVKSFDDVSKAMELPYSTVMNLTNNIYDLSVEEMISWSRHPSNLFLISEYHQQYSGMLFSLRLKPYIFNKIINFEMKINEITNDDFASFEEMGSHLPITFFAYNDKNATLLSLRFYAHLIAYQDIIKDVGATPILESAKKIVLKMNMKAHKEKRVAQGTLTSYTAPLSDILINPSVMKMLFQKQACPEDS